MIQEITMNSVPKRLSHHTSLDSAKKILRDCDGKGIHFRARSNKKKNDRNEIKMGEQLLIKAKEAFDNHQSLLNNISGYFDSASVSFMQGESSAYMVEKYGVCRMDFDLRAYNRELPNDGLVECEYYSPVEFNQFTEEYKQLIKNILKKAYGEKDLYGKASLRSVYTILNIETDIKRKIFTIKDAIWRKEAEWRYVMPLENGDEEAPLYLPRNTLTGIVIFVEDTNSQYAKRCKEDLQNFLDDKKYNIEVSTAPIPLK